jgi:hypothetical protein
MAVVETSLFESFSYPETLKAVQHQKTSCVFFYCTTKFSVCPQTGETDIYPARACLQQVNVELLGVSERLILAYTTCLSIIILNNIANKINYFIKIRFNHFYVGSFQFISFELFKFFCEAIFF